MSTAIRTGRDLVSVAATSVHVGRLAATVFARPPSHRCERRDQLARRPTRPEGGWSLASLMINPGGT